MGTTVLRSIWEDILSRWQINVILTVVPGSNFSRLHIIDKMKCTVSCMWERLSEGKIKLLRVRSVLRRIDKWNAALLSSWTGRWPYRDWNVYCKAWMANGPAGSERSGEKYYWWYNMKYVCTHIISSVIFFTRTLDFQCLYGQYGDAPGPRQRCISFWGNT